MGWAEAVVESVVQLHIFFFAILLVAPSPGVHLKVALLNSVSEVSVQGTHYHKVG